MLTTFKTDEIYYDTLDLIDKDKERRVEVDSLTSVSNILQRLLIVLAFSVCINVLNIFPLLKPLKFALMSVLHSLYVFEYILLQKYIKDFKGILNFLENRLFYFLGFGMLLTILINLISNYTTFIFLMAYPFFMIASVKVYSIRFKSIGSRDIKDTRLRFLYVIGKLYDFGLLIVKKLLYLWKGI
jgi:hypothetical protein